jgi:hypothetical protein
VPVAHPERSSNIDSRESILGIWSRASGNGVPSESRLVRRRTRHRNEREYCSVNAIAAGAISAAILGGAWFLALRHAA